DVGNIGVKVTRGPRLDGVSDTVEGLVESDGDDDSSADEATSALSQAGLDVVVSYLPGGSRRATDFYAEAALSARAAFVNCMPEAAVHSKEISSRFAEANVPLLGDDIKSQFGTTAIHR